MALFLLSAPSRISHDLQQIKSGMTLTKTNRNSSF
jgi:hypothetical protein